ncbi:MAG: hypothetical protein JST27_04905 [Bacteroidetes bacterium]|nr:hypothetical protein [Bacteroidota bacterium]
MAQVKAGQRDFFDLLKTSENNFRDATFEELMSNTDDVLSEVNRVQIGLGSVYFDMFEGCLIKHHDNGDVKWVFYTATRDAKKVLETAAALSKEFGSGIYDNSIALPFNDPGKVALIAQGLEAAVEHDIHTVWVHDDITALLQYRKDPARQFSLMITIRKPKAKDTAIRRRTILESIQWDLDGVLAGQPISADKEFENGTVKFTDFVYSAAKPILGAFDRVRIRQFGDLEYYAAGESTNLTLYASRPIEFQDKIRIAEKLIQLYGADWSGTEDLALHERDRIEAADFWTGRNWCFNEKHSLQDSSNPNDKMSYWLTVDDFQDGDGYKISITGFNNLIELFGTS